MTYSGSSTGGKNPADDNLRWDCYQDFPDGVQALCLSFRIFYSRPSNIADRKYLLQNQMRPDGVPAKQYCIGEGRCLTPEALIKKGLRRGDYFLCKQYYRNSIQSFPCSRLSVTSAHFSVSLVRVPLTNRSLPAPFTYGMPTGG